MSCTICSGPSGDRVLDRVEVWRDACWRLSMSLHGPTLGFAYLEPLRHVPYLADLDEPEASTFGPVIARASRVLRASTGATLVHAYVFGGGIPHLHVHLAPNQPPGVLSEALIEGRVEERPLPGGATAVVSLDHPDLPGAELAAVIERVREAMAAE
jgi:diadenosine tetraphosphate (Ap4A) HIT family hydrolase